MALSTNSSRVGGVGLQHTHGPRRFIQEAKSSRQPILEVCVDKSRARLSQIRQANNRLSSEISPTALSGAWALGIKPPRTIEDGHHTPAKQKLWIVRRALGTERTKGVGCPPADWL